MPEKSARGGARPGAGRKPKPKIELSATKGIATEVFSRLDGKKAPTEVMLWLNLLATKDERLRLDTLKYLTDRRDGKPAQGVFLGDTREGSQALERGNAPSYFGSSAHAPRNLAGSDKPN